MVRVGGMEVMQHSDQHDRHGLGEVDQLAHFG